MDPDKTRGQSRDVSSLRARPYPEVDDAPAWELVGAGRYMPRRIRGSFPGRELG